MTTQSAGVISLQAYFSNLALFAGIGQASLQSLAAAGRVRKIPKGQVVFFQSDPGDALYVVRSGAIVIQLVHPDGREMIINEIGPGDCFGELAVLTGKPRSTSAVALKLTELVVIPGEAFLEVVQSDPIFTRRMLDVLARRLSASTARESSMIFLDAQARLALTLLKLDQQWPEEDLITISQVELAQRTGLTRQTVAKVLGRWRRAGWLITGRGRIMLLNRELLRKVYQESEP
jgi:CRP/FNR family transcriptional regulator, cyclic AMP receptor protein